MLIGEHFTEEERIVDYANDADCDSDPVSITYLTHGEGWEHRDDDIVDGAVVFLKGADAVAAFVAWAVEHGLLTRGKPIRESSSAAC